jgi:hypothetical protein
VLERFRLPDAAANQLSILVTDKPNK